LNGLRFSHDGKRQKKCRTYGRPEKFQNSYSCLYVTRQGLASVAILASEAALELNGVLKRWSMACAASSNLDVVFI
jgi:hypothetical protein